MKSQDTELVAARTLEIRDVDDPVFLDVVWSYIGTEKDVQVWTNQTGGYACNHPYVVAKQVAPPENFSNLVNALEDYAWTVGKGWITARVIQENGEYHLGVNDILKSYGFILDPYHLPESEEAWWFVRKEGDWRLYLIACTNFGTRESEERVSFKASDLTRLLAEHLGPSIDECLQNESRKLQKELQALRAVAEAAKLMLEAFDVGQLSGPESAIFKARAALKSLDALAQAKEGE